MSHRERVLTALRRPRTFLQLRASLRWAEDDKALWDVLNSLKCDGLVQDVCDLSPKWVWELTGAGKARLKRFGSPQRRGTRKA